MILDFVAQSLASGILFFILVNLSSKSDPSFSYLVLETKFEVSILSTLAFNKEYSVFLTTSFFTTLLNLAKSSGTVFNLSVSILSTSVFKEAKLVFNAELLVSTWVISFKSAFVA